MDPAKIVLLLIMGFLGLTFAFCIANLVVNDEACEMRRWCHRKKELEAERILAGAKATDDAWMVEHEAKAQAHEVMKPDLPAWAFWV